MADGTQIKAAIDATEKAIRDVAESLREDYEVSEQAVGELDTIRRKLIYLADTLGHHGPRDRLRSEVRLPFRMIRDKIAKAARPAPVDVEMREKEIENAREMLAEIQDSMEGKL